MTCEEISVWPLSHISQVIEDAPENSRILDQCDERAGPIRQSRPVCARH